MLSSESVVESEDCLSCCRKFKTVFKSAALLLALSTVFNDTIIDSVTAKQNYITVKSI